MSIFHKIKSVFEFRPPGQDSASYHPSVRLLVRPGISEPSLLQELNSHKLLWQLLGYQVTEEELREQIPDGCICLRIIRDEKQQERRAYLQLRIELVEKAKFYWISTDPSILHKGETDHDNIDYP